VAYPTFVGVGDNTYAQGYSNPATVLPLPATTQVGDYVVILGSVGPGSAAVTAITGFTLLANTSTGDGNAYAFGKFFSNGDIPAIHPGNRFISNWRTVVFRGVDTTTAIEAARATQGFETDNAINIPAGSASIGECVQLVLAGNIQEGTPTYTANAPLTQIAQGGTNQTFIIASANGPASAGSVSAKSISTPSAALHANLSFLLRSADPSPVTVTPVSFSGPVDNQTATAGVSGSLDLTSYFSGNQTPFTYTLVGGSLAGTGLSLTNGVISGSPTASGTIAGLQVRATDSAGNTAQTNTFSITVSAAAQVPQGTFSVGSITVGQNTASVPYTYNAGDATSIQYRINGTGTAFTATASPQAITGLTAGTQYSIQFRAVNAVGPQSTWSTAVSFTTSAAGAPATIVSEPLRNLAGVLLANKPLNYVAAFNKDTRALVAQKTGLTTDANGRFTFSDVALTAGTDYRWDWETVDGERRMPIKAAV